MQSILPKRYYTRETNHNYNHTHLGHRQYFSTRSRLGAFKYPDWVGFGFLPCYRLLGLN